MTGATAGPRAIVLLGPRGAGKTTLAPRLAAALGWTWQDGDALLAEAVGCPAPEFLRRHGEAAFRAREAGITTAALAAARDTVLALGGGAVLLPAVQQALRAPDLLPILLLPDLPTLVRRQAAAPRPALTTLPLAEEVAALLAERLPLYRSLAAITLDTGAEDPESCVRRIVGRLRAGP